MSGNKTADQNEKDNGSQEETNLLQEQDVKDDDAKGGDIDLLVLSKRINLMTKLDILAQLHQKLGERKIDIAVYPDTTRPFPRMVMQEGVRLDARKG